MNNLFTGILDLPEEILVNIFNKLHNLDVLYSIIGSNRKLDKIACDRTFVQSIDLTRIFSNEKDNSKTSGILDRFCLEIIPRIHNKIQHLTIETSLLERILYTNEFINLHRITLVNFNIYMDSNIFNETSPFIVNFKHQISELILIIEYEVPSSSMFTLLIDTYRRIFHLISNLKYLDLDVYSNYFFPISLLHDHPPTTCSSSTITYLRIKLHNIDDCLHLLDGRLSRLHSFLVKLDFIHDPELLRNNNALEVTQYTSELLNNTKNLDKLKYFSLCVTHATSEFDSLVIPLVHRMIYLENLTLSLRLRYRTSFIDCDYLKSSLLKHMSSLQKFNFNFGIDHLFINADEVRPSIDSIRRTFIENEYNTDGYVYCTNYLNQILCQCHVYSLPYLTDYLQPISHSFPGGLFENVTAIWLRDEFNSFEHDFFLKISQSFPLLRRLVILNRIGQKQEPKEASSIIEFSHLIELNCRCIHMSYVEQMLYDSNTRLPSLIRLFVQYEHLSTVTENFTRNATRINCAGLKSIILDHELAMVHSKDFYQYFPSLQIVCSSA